MNKWWVKMGKESVARRLARFARAFIYKCSISCNFLNAWVHNSFSQHVRNFLQILLNKLSTHTCYQRTLHDPTCPLSRGFMWK